MAEEDLCCTRSSSGRALKPGEAFIQIDSILIDLPNVNSKNEETTACEHFSIRKYVSNMRQRDNKACWLFESEMKYGSAALKPKYPLPPLDVPKFRWWQCINCLQGICEEENGKSVLANNLNSECNQNGPSYTHIALTRSETMVLVSELKQILKLGRAEKGEANADRLVQVAANKSRVLLGNDQEEERDVGSDGAIKAPENDLEVNGCLELPTPIPTATEVNESQGHELKADDAAGLKSLSANHEVTGLVSSLKNLQMLRDASHDHDQDMKAMRSSRTPSVAVDGVKCGSETLTVHQNGHPSDVLNYASSDSAGVCPGYRSQDKPSALRRRKVRKVRLLSDLLGQNGKLNINTVGGEESPLPAISDVKKVFQRPKMKRKFHPDYDTKDVILYKEASAVETFMESAEENQKVIVETVEDATFAATSPTSIMKSRTPREEDRSSGLVMKKIKKTNEVESLQHVVSRASVLPEIENDAYFLTGPVDTPKYDLTEHFEDGSWRIVTKKKKKKMKTKLTQESFQGKLCEVRGKVAVDFCQASYGHDALTCREMGSSLSPVLKTDRNSCMCKEKSKMLHNEDDHIARIPQSSNSKIREDSFSGIKFGLVQSSPKTARFLPNADCVVKKGTGISSYIGKTEAKYALPHDVGPASTIPWQQVRLKEGQVHKKNIMSTHLEPDVPSLSRLDGFLKKGFHHNHKSKEPSYRMPFINDKQHCASHFEDVGHFLIPQKEISIATSKGEITGSQEQLTVTKNHSNEISNKASARGTCLDDIPMEIVELMAKIQYENSLHDNLEERIRLDPGKSPSYQNLKFGREYKNGDLNVLQKEGSTGDQTLLKNVKKLDNAKQKAIDINCSPQVNTNYPITIQVEQNHKQNHFTGQGILFSQCYEKPSGSKSGENTMDGSHETAFGTIRGLSACNTCHVAGPSKEPFCLCSSSLISIPRVPAQKNVPKSGILQSSYLLSRGFKVRNKSEDPNKAIHMENSGGENLYASKQNGVKVQSPVSSSDFYSNEKISALHLLSLMDAHSDQNANGKPRLAKQSSSVLHRRPKELDFGVYKASDALRHPSSDYNTINFLGLGKYDQYSSAVPTLGSSSLFETYENPRNGVMGQVSLKVREKGKKRCSDFVGSIGGSGSQKHVPSVCIPVHNQQKNEFIEVPNSMVIPPKCHIVDNSEEHLRCGTGSAWPLRYGSGMGICTINRNPAEFSVPEVGNVYTIRGSKLRFGKRVRALEWPAASVIDLDRPKRGRKKKIATNHQQVEN